MKEFFLSSAYGGLFLCVITYLFFARIQKKIHILNPLLFSALACILFLVLGRISYGEFQKSASFLSSLLTPATVALAIPLYRRRMLLVRYGRWILTSIAFGSFVSMFLVWLCARLMGLSKDLAISFLLKSVTTAIGLDLVKEFGGISALTAATIIITGVVGSLLDSTSCGQGNCGRSEFSCNGDKCFAVGRRGSRSNCFGFDCFNRYIYGDFHEFFCLFLVENVEYGGRDLRINKGVLWKKS